MTLCAFAEIGPIYFGLWCAENGVLNQFSQSLFIEILSRDSLLARTEKKTRSQDRQEAALGAVLTVSACHSETVLDSSGYRGRPPGPLLPLQATVTRAVRSRAGFRPNSSGSEGDGGREAGGGGG